MSKKLAAKASLIQAPEPLPAAPALPPGADAKPRTAPGTMAAFIASQSTAAAELESFRERLKAFDGASPVRPLDPRQVRPSRWANRHAASFEEPAFVALKAEIAAAGGNVQPIKVRPLAAGEGAAAQWEIVYGHRRHRACLELGLAVVAQIEPLDDQGLFEAMERENRGRKSLSAWEQGMMYRRALEGGLYPSQRRLAEALGVDVALVSRGLALARLPATVLAAFRSPLEIQFRWAQPLSEALQKDPDGVVSRARQISAEGASLPARSVLDRLLGVLNRSTPPTEEPIGPAGQGASFSRDAAGQATLRFAAGALTPERERELRALLAQWWPEG